MSLSKKALVAALIAVLILSAAAIPGLAQSPVTAEVDRNSLSTDESLILTVSYSSGSGAPTSPILPPLDGFRVDGTSSGRSISIYNGNMTVKITYQYQLTPTRAGNLEIGPVAVNIDGQDFYSNPIPISVTQGTGIPQPQSGTNPGFPSIPGFPNMPGFPNFPSLPDWLFAPQGSSQSGAPAAPDQPAPSLDPEAVPTELIGQDLFVESVVNNQTPYQGEGLNHTFRFFQAIELFGQLEYAAPSFTGFWHDQVGDPQVYTVQAAGRNYRITEIQTLLFPTVVGEIEIEPAKIKTPGGFFQEGSNLETRPLTLDVQPLPPDAPPGFMGAVGQFSLNAEVDKTATEVNDTITMKVVISGRGNLETAPDPTWTEGSEWRVFDSDAVVNSWMEDGQRVGTRTYERTLVPTTPGDLTIPPVEYIYFNPETGSYETARTESVTVLVAPDASAPVPDTSSLEGDPGSTVDLAAPETLNQLLPNKESLRTTSSGNTPLTEKPGYWLLWTLPVLFLAGQFAWQEGKKRRNANPAARRSQAAEKKARQAIRTARRDPAGGSAKVSVILRSYLEDKFDQPVSGLTENGLTNLLLEKGVDGELAMRVADCLHRSEIARFAPDDPTGETSRELLNEAAGLINALEKILP